MARNDGISDENDIKGFLKTVEATFKKDIKDVAGIAYFLKEVLLPITDSRDIASDIYDKIFKVIFEVRDRSKDAKEDFMDWLRRNVMAEYTCMTMRDNRELYIYSEKRGVYLPGQEWRIRELCQSLCHSIKTAAIEEVIARVKNLTPINRAKFDSNLDVINLKNGLLNIHTFEFTEHSPNHLSTVQLPIEYDPKATCPRILKFLSQILKPEDIKVILQLIGYCLYRKNKYEKAFIFYGSGGNGKSTLLRIIEHFLGFTNLHKNVSHVSLHDLAKNRFKPAELFGKSANIYADLGNKKISSEHWGTIKMLISGDSMSVERKNRDPFEFTPFAKMLFSCNEIPELPDNTYATWRRLILLEFEHVFSEENKDVNLVSKLTTPEEMSGLLNMVLRSLGGLVSRNEFAYTKDIEMVRRAYELNSNIMGKFVDKRIESLGADSKDYVTCRETYEAYVGVCSDEEQPCKKIEELGAYLAIHLAGRWGGRRRKRINGEEEYVYYGIKLNDEARQDSNTNGW